MNPGTLYLCATPIGNLEDMTFRVIRTLKEVDMIAAEDTRNSIKLLNHFEIKTPMTSYHEYNKIEKGHKLVQMLLEGKNLALITDAGTPGISDPGEELVQMCYEAGVPVTSLPGAAACITALTLSGLSTRRFAFGNRRITICRELTKKHETAWQTHIAEACEYYQENAPKGECVLVIEGRSREELKAEEQEQWEQMPLEAHMEHYESQGMDHKSAMKQVAKDRGVSKRDIYRMLLELGQSD